MKINDKEFFKRIEGLEYVKVPGNFKMTFHYVNGETETFHSDHDPRYLLLHGAKERKQYYFVDNTLISMRNVVKIHFEDLDKSK